MKKKGIEESVVKEWIAAVMVEEIYDVMKHQEEFNEDRYCKKLRDLERKAK